MLKVCINKEVFCVIVFQIMPKNGESQGALHFKTLKLYIIVGSICIRCFGNCECLRNNHRGTTASVV